MQTSATHQSDVFMHLQHFSPLPVYPSPTPRCRWLIFMYINLCLSRNQSVRLPYTVLILFFCLLVCQLFGVHIVTSWTLRERPGLRHPDSPSLQLSQSSQPTTTSPPPLWPKLTNHQFQVIVPPHACHTHTTYVVVHESACGIVAVSVSLPLLVPLSLIGWKCMRNVLEI